MIGRWLAGLALASVVVATAPASAEVPHIVARDGRHALMVDGAQMNSSNSRPAVMSRAWPTMEALHVNTAKAPVAYEQID